jgi:multidrug transporter EmrE-like cation transporter
MRGRAFGAWTALAATVVLEVAATLTLKASEEFTVLWPSVVSVACYAGTVVALAIALNAIPMSLAYVVWTGAGTAGVAILGVILFGDSMNTAAWLGLALVTAGVVIINSQKHDGSEQKRDA